MPHFRLENNQRSQQDDFWTHPEVKTIFEGLEWFFPRSNRSTNAWNRCFCMLTRKIESESWAEANAQTKIDNQSIEVAADSKQTLTCPHFFSTDTLVFQIDFPVDQKLPSINQRSSRKIKGKKVKLFLASRQVKSRWKLSFRWLQTTLKWKFQKSVTQSSRV